MSRDQNTGSESPRPPKWLDRFARWICAPHLHETLIGDLHERYALRASRFGASKANTMYIREVLCLIRPAIIRRKNASDSASPFFNFDMLSNYFKISSRVLIKHRGYSLIHLIGLSVGIGACMMVATVVVDSLSYDRQWTRSNDIYRIVMVNHRGEGLDERMASSMVCLPPELKKNYPDEVETYAGLATGSVHFSFEKTEMNGIKANVLHMDTAAWSMLDVKVLLGNPRQYQSGTNNIVISKTFRDKFFAGQNPIGKVVYDTPKYDAKANSYVITGVMEDLPYNSHLRADILWLYPKRLEVVGSLAQVCGGGPNYVLMKRGTDINGFQAKVNLWYNRLANKDFGNYSFEFQPIRDIYLHSDFAQGQSIKGDARTIYIFSGVALLLLFIACVNFVNLSTARAFSRLKETGVRRILSGSRYHVLMQILTETFVLFGASAVVAVLVYYFSLPSVETLLGHKLVETFTSNASLAVAGAGGILLTCLLTGLYPAWMISSLKPSDTIRGVFSSSLKQTWLRKGLVVTQFSISIVVLITTIVVRQQLSYMENKNLGYNKNNLLAIGNVSWDGKGEAFKSEVMRIPGVVIASVSQWTPADGGGSMMRDVEDPANSKAKLKVWYVVGDVDLPKALGLNLLKGRMFDAKYGSDAINEDSLWNVGSEAHDKASKLQSSLLTESAAKVLRVSELGTELKDVKTSPVGIIENFNNESLYESVKPTVIIAQRSAQYGSMLIRTEPGMEASVTVAVQKLWKQFFTSKLLEINSVDDLLAKQYEAESRLQQLFVFFSTLTMFLSALGIFGLAVQAVEQRGKEVGIRKVLGASVASIAALLSKDFVKLVSVAIIIASPVAWFGVDKWLQSYPFRTDVSWWIFLAAGFGAIFITLLTVSFQAVKAAMVDPVKSLKNE